MRRREFLLVAPAVIAARAVRAQQKAMPVIGFLHGGSSGSSAANVAAFREGLEEAGYVEGQNLAVKYRWAEGRLDRLPELAADLVARKVDVIAALSSASALATNRVMGRLLADVRSMRQSGPITVSCRAGTVLPHGVAVRHRWIIASGVGAIVPGLPGVGL